MLTVCLTFQLGKQGSWPVGILHPGLSTLLPQECQSFASCICQGSCCKSSGISCTHLLYSNYLARTDTHKNAHSLMHPFLSLKHTFFLLQREEVPVVRRPDRKELLAFLKGTDSQVPKSIDKSARLEMPTHVKRSAEDKLEITSAKKARLDVGQVFYFS